jgi:hypothetical protein
LEDGDIGKLLLNLINRSRFEYRVRDILENIAKCVCFRRVIRTNYKKHHLYNKCVEKVQHDLDIVNMLKHHRQTKLLSQIVLDQRQKLLLRF